MIGRRGFAGMILGGVAFMALAGCEKNRSRFNVKVTVEVDTPAGVRTGFSVYEISAANLTATLPDAAERTWSTRGEAVAVDLPNGQTLFALMQTGAIHGDIASMVLATLDAEFDNSMVESTQKLSNIGGEGYLLPVAPQNYPLMVRFADINDPKTVEKVEASDLSASFGTGYRIKAVTAQVVQDAVTTGIEKRFSWWQKYRIERRRLNGSNSILVSTNELIDNIGTGEFSTGVE
jgi:hypothetical protein